MARRDEDLAGAQLPPGFELPVQAETDDIERIPPWMLMGSDQQQKPDAPPDVDNDFDVDGRSWDWKLPESGGFSVADALAYEQSDGAPPQPVRTGPSRRLVFAVTAAVVVLIVIALTGYAVASGDDSAAPAPVSVTPTKPAVHTSRAPTQTAQEAPVVTKPPVRPVVPVTTPVTPASKKPSTTPTRARSAPSKKRTTQAAPPPTSRRTTAPVRQQPASPAPTINVSFYFSTSGSSLKATVTLGGSAKHVTAVLHVSGPKTGNYTVTSSGSGGHSYKRSLSLPPGRYTLYATASGGGASATSSSSSATMV